MGVQEVDAVQTLAPVDAALDAPQRWLALKSAGGGGGCDGPGGRARVYPSGGRGRVVGWRVGVGEGQTHSTLIPAHSGVREGAAGWCSAVDPVQGENMGGGHAGLQPYPLPAHGRGLRGGRRYGCGPCRPTPTQQYAYRFGV